MSIRELLDDGGATVESWKRLKVASIRSSNIDLIQGSTAVTSDYAVFPGLRFRAAAGNAGSNITGAAADATITLIFSKVGPTWFISAKCFDAGVESFTFHVTADATAALLDGATDAIEIQLRDFLNANIIPANFIAGDEVRCPLLLTNGVALVLGNIRFAKRAAGGTICQLGDATNHGTLRAANIFTHFTVAAPAL